ncbi:MAG: hydantoinase B/oxoprolinase family protein, partial [bacterium]
TMELFLANTRVPAERMGDLDAQVAALRSGDQRLSELAARFGPGRITRAMKELQDYSQRLVEAMIKELPTGEFNARDSLDNDGIDPEPLRLSVTLRRRGKRLEIDLRGCAPQCRGPLNANLAVTTSAVFYVVACLAGSRVPANRGMMEPVDILTTPGTLVDCRFPAAVAGGNVETSQRIVDLLLRALARALPGRVPAASSGTMNNLTLGGWDVHRDRHFAYYETVAGGAGAGPSGPGCHALHTHMTNTLNTPVELLESYYPLRVIRYGLRRRSGGAGKHRGGDGIDREIEVLVPATLTLLADRRQEGPWGLAGGKPGLPGRDTVSSCGRTKAIASKTELQLAAGDRVRVQTPGGGGWGRVRRKVAGKKKRG